MAANIVLIRCHGIRKASRHGVDFGASQFLRSNLFSSGTLNQGRSTEKSLSLILHENGIVREGRVVGASSR